MSDTSEIAALFDEWNSALNSGDPARVAALYAEDAVLLPTMSNQVRTTPDGIREYFAEFLTASPQGTVRESAIRLLCEDVACHCGIYVFELTSGGKRVTVPARFSFVYQRRADGWKIREHHSSVMPEPIDA